MLQDIIFQHEKYNKIVYLKNEKSANKIKCLCWLCCILTFTIVWIVFDSLILNRDSNSDLCSGSLCQKQLCDNVYKNQLSGHLCMDLCITKTLTIPQCSHITSNSVQFYQIEKPESTLICSMKRLEFDTKEGTNMLEFQDNLKQKFLKYLNYSLSVDKIVDRLIDFGDVNRDERINLAEANNIMTLLNNKYTLFQIMFAGKSYASTIKNFCGGCIEIEQIISQVRLKTESIIESVLSPFTRWPEWNYRIKISIGIMEFFMDILSINPNDEFGTSSLYLCSSIETSFGYTFFNEAKVINFENLISAKEMELELSNRVCIKDSDCVYNDYCSAACNKETKKCSPYLVKPQIVDYCLFLRKYLLDNKNITHILEPILDECETLKMLPNTNNALYTKNDMLLSWDKHKDLLAATVYWKRSREFTRVTNQLKSTLWNWTKFSKDPVKATTKTTKTAETTLAKKI